MSQTNDEDYYLRRESHERRLMEAATMPEIRKIHAQLAENYATLAREAQDIVKIRPVLRIAV